MRAPVYVCVCVCAPSQGRADCPRMQGQKLQVTSWAPSSLLESLLLFEKAIMGGGGGGGFYKSF